MQHSILVGTSKGLVIFDDHQNKFQISKVHFPGFPVSMAFVDERDDTWWVSLSHKHWGEKLHYSRDKGKAWLAANLPSYSTYNYRPNIPATLKKIWVMSHAGKNIADGLWLGSEPGGLFFSDDNGTTFSLNEGLWNHPS
ncbi:MAG: glycosyl hydrolase, partial [Cyclobacteriaceae bacterium]